MVEVFALNIAQTKSLDQMKHLISPEKQKRIEKIKHFPTAQQVLAGEILARSIISKKFGLNNRAIIFCYNEYGKPGLKNSKDFHFNLSHSGDWVVMAVSSTEVGIDIEQAVSIDLSIAELIFSPNEYQQLKSMPVSLQIDYFYQIWTLKESYIKMTGQGLSAALNSFSIQIKEGNKFPELKKTPHEKVQFRQYELEGCYKISVCSRFNTFSPQLTKINDEFFLDILSFNQ